MRGPAVAGSGSTIKLRQVVIAALVAFVLFVVVRGLFFHENKYETIARELTVALQKNDLPAVEKYQNAEKNN